MPVSPAFLQNKMLKRSSIVVCARAKGLGSPNGDRTRVFPLAQAEYPGVKKEVDPDSGNLLLQSGSPNGNRTRVFGVRGRYPRPLDDGTSKMNEPCF